MSKIEVIANIEYPLDNKTILISFKDANQQHMLLEIDVSELPPDFEDNDKFTLAINNDEISGQETYTVKPDSLIKSSKPVDDRPIPKNWDDPEQMAVYAKWLDERFGGSNRGPNSGGGMSL